MGLAFRDKRVRLIRITAHSAETGFRVKLDFLQPQLATLVVFVAYLVI